MEVVECFTGAVDEVLKDDIKLLADPRNRKVSYTIVLNS